MRYLGSLILLTFVSSAYSLDFGRVMLVGDSTTAGTASGAHDAFRPYLDNLMQSNGDSRLWVGPEHWGTYASGLAADHAGYGGWGIDRLLNGNTANPGAGKYSDWLSAYSPDTIFIMAGSNSWWRFRNTYLTDPNTVSSSNVFLHDHFEDFVNQAISSNPNSRVVLSSCLVSEYSTNVAQGINTWFDDMGTILQSIAAEHQALGQHVTYLDLHEQTTALSQDHAMTADGTHWNEIGAQEGAGIIYGGLSNSAVPEPTSLVILGGVALVAAARRKAKHN